MEGRYGERKARGQENDTTGKTTSLMRLQAPIACLWPAGRCGGKGRRARLFRLSRDRGGGRDLVENVGARLTLQIETTCQTHDPILPQPSCSPPSRSPLSSEPNIPDSARHESHTGCTGAAH